MSEDHGAALLDAIVGAWEEVAEDPGATIIHLEQVQRRANALIAERDAAIDRAERAEEQRDRARADLRESLAKLTDGDTAFWAKLEKDLPGRREKEIARILAALADDPQQKPQRIPDGTMGIRDTDAPCEFFNPGTPEGASAGGRECFGDGHYLCRECLSFTPE